MDIFTWYVIVWSQNKNTDFLMILAWLCRFKYAHTLYFTERV